MHEYTEEYKGYTITIDYDQWADNPSNWGNFEVVTFGRGDLVTDVDRDDYDMAVIRRKLKDGRAFWIDIYDHSGTSYSLSGEGMQCRFDTASKAGLIIFDDEYVKGTNYAERSDYARGDLRSYSAWANGEMYDVSITDTDGEYIDGCGGYDDVEYAIAEAKGMIDSYTGSVNVTEATA